MVQTVGSETDEQLASWLTYLPIIQMVGSETGWEDSFETGCVDTNVVVACFKTCKYMHQSFEQLKLKCETATYEWNW